MLCARPHASRSRLCPTVPEWLTPDNECSSSMDTGIAVMVGRTRTGLIHRAQEIFEFDRPHRRIIVGNAVG